MRNSCPKNSNISEFNMSLSSGEKGLIFDIKRFAIHDGPGIRTTLFFKGCPLRCDICHNPESQRFEKELMVRRNLCISCGECAAACRSGALESGRLNRDLCTSCGSCADVCPSGALELLGRELTVAEALEEIERDLVFYDESGGGVTFSGGEPLAQLNFLLRLLKSCKKRKIHTVVDTSGFAPNEVIKRVAEYVDLFLYDLKVIDNEKHLEFTGESNREILDNLRWLLENGKKVRVRFPFAPGSTGGDERNVRALADFLRNLKSKPIIDIMPYHAAGVLKYKRLNRPYKSSELKPPSEKQIEDAVLLLRGFGLHVLVKGDVLKAVGFDDENQNMSD